MCAHLHILTHFQCALTFLYGVQTFPLAFPQMLYMLLQVLLNSSSHSTEQHSYVANPSTDFHGLPMQETWVRSQVQEEPLEEEMATHFSILAWETPRTDEPGGLHSMGLQKSQT